MRSIFFAAMLALTAPTAVFAQAEPKFSTASSSINELLGNAKAKAVLEKYVPQIAQAGAMVGDRTMKQVQSMAPDRLPDETLAKIDAELSKIK